jgi:hypothetical protein
VVALFPWRGRPRLGPRQTATRARKATPHSSAPSSSWKAVDRGDPRHAQRPPRQLPRARTRRPRDQRLDALTRLATLTEAGLLTAPSTKAHRSQSPTSSPEQAAPSYRPSDRSAAGPTNTSPPACQPTGLDREQSSDATRKPRKVFLILGTRRADRTPMPP